MIDHRVRDWLLARPGLVEAPTHDECLRKAWAACGVCCSVHDFAAALWRAGYAPVQVHNRFRLALPEFSPGVRRT